MPTSPVSWGASLRGQLSFVLGCHWLKPLTRTPGLGTLLPLSRMCYGTPVKFLFKVGNFPPFWFLYQDSPWEHNAIGNAKPSHTPTNTQTSTYMCLCLHVCVYIAVHAHGERTPASGAVAGAPLGPVGGRIPQALQVKF